jgi:hypothetical protein
MFHGNHVTAYGDLITSKTHDLVARWPGGTTVDVRQEMTQLTLSDICRLLLGGLEIYTGLSGKTAAPGEASPAFQVGAREWEEECLAYAGKGIVFPETNGVSGKEAPRRNHKK